MRQNLIISPFLSLSGELFEHRSTEFFLVIMVLSEHGSFVVGTA
jgi:hypothetical protein